MQAIRDRRSIRTFLDIPVERQDIEDILQSAVLAPSSKNRQPWKFVVVQGEAKAEMLKAFRTGIAREESGDALLPQSKKYIEGAKLTVHSMEQAPVVILALNPLGKGVLANLTPEERVYETCNIQSLSASLQNMLLAATEKGLGSLWICDIFFAYKELCAWLGDQGELIAAVAIGRTNESPAVRPRKSLTDVVEWRN
ncbi:MAG: nitroreductase family protein [Treponema sp.]|nr:nitroreductase family protein [Treponema sp.]MBD5410739.1 nitroreductase family protein [Treponema sp.]